MLHYARSVLYFQFISVRTRAILQYNRVDWSRSMVDKSADLENDVMTVQFVLLFLSRAIFRKEVKNVQYFCKKQIGTDFSWSIYSYRP